MKQSAYERARDVRIATEATDDPLRCPAHGCPHKWAVDGDRGRACSAHYWAERHDWPRITDELLRHEADRAMWRAAAPAAPMTREQRQAVLARLREIGTGPSDRLAWARRLRARHQAGERLTRDLIAAYRHALPERAQDDDAA